MFLPIPSIFALVGILLSQQNSVHCATANVNLAGVRQTIQGFGASSAWQGRASDNAMNSLFANGNNNQIGLSIIRLRIDPNKNWGDEISNAQKATSRGAQVMATPWTAPAWMKTSNNVNGGSLKTDQYQAYADHLNSFVQQLRNSGVQLYAISVQNEPDIKVTYESMDWNPSQMVTFLKNFGSRIQGTKIMAAESFQFRKDITDAILNDPSAASKVAIIAGHIYGGGLGSYPLAKQKGKQLWMTEHFNDGWDWASCMQTAKEIHDSMTIAEYNAYFLWWFKNEKNSLGPLDGNGNPTIRAYVIGQWSKYVRPGFVRVDATYTPSNGVFISAFKNGNKVVIVAVNMGDTVSQQFSIGGGPIPSTFTPHISSEWKKISNEANVNVANGSFTYTLQAKSVTTFVSN